MSLSKEQMTIILGSALDIIALSKMSKMKRDNELKQFLADAKMELLGEEAKDPEIGFELKVQVKCTKLLMTLAEEDWPTAASLVEESMQE